MKTICLFGRLRGFENRLIAKTVGDLLHLAGQEEVVVICHGMPSADDGGPVDPLLLSQDLNLHAFLLVQSGDGAHTSELKTLKEKLAQKCPRTFGMVRGWNSQSANWENIIAFLESSELAPGNTEVQQLLGFDSPVSRLALRFALEIALRELGGQAPKRPGNALTLEMLLAPALALAEQEPSLARSVSGISRALAADRKSLPQEITQALAELRS